ncbi:ATP-binding cassette domain-containing protein [Carboxylicivirga sediminis]|uniref:ATP-binding cassette domain-containing protein n=1 Tax=Carboxylicivirga sediminis TaxID=2006564 RepID=A0A941IWM3_9BACT|nr:ATP-binding cassette domain-containing protein [Carboxylicivirga sediminis]MBR8534703.1 ATP-binding cassette domain-containing protein [Carboxylicivirga sediminis]
MSELFLDALMQIFALLTDQREEQKTGDGFIEVKNFLLRNLNNEYAEQALERYEFYINEYHKDSYSKDQKVRDKQASTNMDRLAKICEELNQELEQSEKYMLITNMLNFIMRDGRVSEEERFFTDALAKHLKLDERDYTNLRKFILYYPLEVDDKDRLLLISGQKEKPDENIKHIYNPKQQIFVWVLHVQETNLLFFRYSGNRNLYLNGHIIEQNKGVAFRPGAVIKTSRMAPVYYGRVAEHFIARPGRARILYRALDVSYKFNNNQVGIHPFSFSGRSGQLVAVMGGSGTGKSTLLNVLNGNLKYHSGRIHINGFDLHKDAEALAGVIGYVPQDDLLKEELTVFENLYFNARLCFSHFNKDEITELVEKALHDFDLVEARDLVVGSPLNKILSGGQRKRLNIALELIREPSVLFVDEPTSGLSSMDSEKVMLLLKRQTLKGKLVFINIHQPSSDLYKLIDKLLIIDKGGRIIYNGNPMDAITYFKKKASYVNPEEKECYACGNVQTEQPLRIIEARMVNPYGKFIRQRKVSPQEWYKYYVENFEDKFEWKEPQHNAKREKLPANLYNIPGRIQQFVIYFLRDTLSKIKDNQYMMINMMQAPILALILGYFTKFISGDGADDSAYVFANNVNIPAYLFMCVVVALFLGLIVSAEEIFKDRRLLQRESFLNLSRFSYLNSKIVVLFAISAVQTLSFVLIGNYILEIKGLTLSYWLILFSTACYANMLGLNISSGLNSVVAIYVLIPLILVPQLLFSGVIVNFDKLHKTISSEQYVPRIGDLMTSRWSYEALAVNQFKNNAYEKYFFDLDQQISSASYNSNLLIPKLNDLNETCRYHFERQEQDELQHASQLLVAELLKLTGRKISHYPFLAYNLSGRFEYGTEAYEKIAELLQQESENNKNLYVQGKNKRDQLYEELIGKYGSKEAFLEFKDTYQNDALEEVVLNKRELKQMVVTGHGIIQKKHPIFNKPVSNFGRSHLYAADKRVLDVYISTPLFNMIIVWMGVVFFYITLYFDILRKVIRYFETFKLRRLNQRLQKIRT